MSYEVDNYLPTINRKQFESANEEKRTQSNTLLEEAQRAVRQLRKSTVGCSLEQLSCSSMNRSSMNR
jgi:hypothetical protein